MGSDSFSVTKARKPWRVLAGLAALTLVAGCSMSTQWFIQKSLLDAGFSRNEARCAVDGVASQLSQDQLWSLRAPLIRYIMLDNPPMPMDIGRFLAWLSSQVTPEVHQMVTHYATRCRAER
jgi:hypothetical protein